MHGSPEQQRRWGDYAAATFSFEQLRHIEDELIKNVKARYIFDKGSLFNWRYYHEGPQEIDHIRHVFDGLYRRQVERIGFYVETVEEEEWDDQLEARRDRQYLRRRTVARRRHADEIEDIIDVELAEDPGLQATLTQGEAAHRQHLELLQVEAEIARQSQKLMAELEDARRRLDRPHELTLKLHELLESLLKYQMSLNDRALRNPALADRLRMMGLGLTAVMASVQQLIGELNRAGETPPDPERLRQQSDAVLAMAMEQMQQWQQANRSEPDL